MHKERGERACVSGAGKRGFAKLTNASFSFTAKFKDKVDVLSNIAKAEASAGQGSKPEGEHTGVRAVCFVLQSLTFPALSAQGLAKKHYSPTQIFCYCWSQMAANRCTGTGGNKSHPHRSLGVVSEIPAQQKVLHFPCSSWVRRLTGAAQRTLQLFPCVCQQFFIFISIPTKQLGIEVREHTAIISQLLGEGQALLEKKKEAKLSVLSGL